MQPLVSILMPVFNVKSYLDLAIRSVFAQTHHNWELILVDDSSTDGTKDFLLSLDDERVTVIQNARNVGQPISINLAIDVAHGKYLTRFDGDDLMVPERLERQLAYAVAHPSVDMHGTGSFSTNSDLELLMVWRPPTEHTDITKRPAWDIPVMYGSMFACAEWWKRWKHDPRTKYPGIAFEINYRSHRESTLANIPDPLYIYRFFGNTSSWRKRTLGVWRKAQVLARHGFRKGMVLQTLSGLASLAPRPFLYILMDLTRQNRGIVKSMSLTPTEEDQRAYAKAMEVIRKTEIPFRRAPDRDENLTAS